MEIIKLLLGAGFLDKFSDLFKGKERRAQEFLIEVAEKMQAINEKQIEVNREEAKHKTIFVAGWRPFIGWVCGCALAYQFIVRDFIAYLMRVLGSSAELPPTLDITHLITIVVGMLGLAKLRSEDKKILKIK